MKSSQLVMQRLENLSFRVFEQYPRIVKQLSQRKPGLYALYRRGELYYVGLASSLAGRLNQHLRDRHSKRWDRFSLYLTVSDEHMKELESLILRIVHPEGNRVRGRLRGSQDLRPLVNARIKQADDARRARLLGGHVAERYMRRRARAGLGTEALSGLFERRTVLVGRFRGKRYKAVLRVDGRIHMRGKRYESPFAAVKALGVKQNGWTFWHFQDEDGEWVPLAGLRR